MADQKLSDLTALTAPSGDDLLYVVDDPAGTPSDKKLALDNLFTRGTVTVSSPVIDAAQTWNAGGVTFTGLKFNAATGSNTGSATASLLMDLQLEGASKFSVSKNGFLQTASDILFSSGSGRISRQAGYGGIVFDASNQITLGVDSTITLIGGTNGRFCIGATDLLLTRRAAANLRFGAADAAAPVAQTLSVQSVVAGTTNIAGANLTITGSQGTGTGAGGEFRVDLAPPGTSGSAQNALTNAFRLIKDNAVRTTFLISSSGGDAGFFAEGNSFTFTSSNHNFNVPGALFNRGTGFGFFIGSGGNRSGLYGGTEEANDTLAQRRGANAQAFRVYNTFTDATTFERANIFWDSNVLKIGTEKGSVGGTARALEFQTDGTTRLTIATSGNATFSGAINGNSDLRAGQSSYIWWNNRSQLSAPADGNILMFNFAANDFGRLQFGGTTSSFPALKRSSASLIVRLADDSADAALSASTLTSTASTANTSSIAASGYSLTGSSAVSMVDLGGTWDTTGVPTLIKANVTNTASGAGALLLDLQKGTTSQFKVDKDGNTVTTGSVTTAAPAGGTAAAWKLGAVASVSPTSPDRTIEVDIGGTIYYLAAKTTND